MSIYKKYADIGNTNSHIMDIEFPENKEDNTKIRPERLIIAWTHI